MGAGAFEAFYRGELQGLWLLLPVPALFLLWWALGGRARIADCGRDGADFVASYAGVFGLLTILDPIAGGPGVRWLGLEGAAASAVVFAFVWLGDFRVLFLVFGLMRAGQPLAHAALWTFLVPAVDVVLHFGLLRGLLWPEVPDQALWLVHELAFLTLAVWVRQRLLPQLDRQGLDEHRRFLETALLYVALYYALWAAADVLILTGVDLGWALRVVPNQLYYAFWVPFVALRFAERR